MCSIFNTFGHIPDMTTNLFVTFNFWTTDGRNIEKKFDISDIFKTEDCIKRHWILVNETVVIRRRKSRSPAQEADSTRALETGMKNTMK